MKKLMVSFLLSASIAGAMEQAPEPMDIDSQNNYFNGLPLVLPSDLRNEIMKYYLLNNHPAAIFNWLFDAQNKKRELAKPFLKINLNKGLEWQGSISPDGAEMIVQDGKNIYVYNPTTGKEWKKADGFPYLCAIGQNGFIAHQLDRGQVELWNYRENKFIKSIAISGYVRSLSFNRDNTMLAIAHSNGFTIYNLVNESRCGTSTHGGVNFNHIVFSPTNNDFVTVSSQDTVRLWTINGNILTDKKLSTSDKLNKIHFNAQGTALVGIHGKHFDAETSVWDLKNDSMQRTNDIGIEDAFFYPNNDDYLFKIYGSGMVKLYQISTQQLTTLGQILTGEKTVLSPSGLALIGETSNVTNSTRDIHFAAHRLFDLTDLQKLQYNALNGAI